MLMVWHYSLCGNCKKLLIYVILFFPRILRKNQFDDYSMYVYWQRWWFLQGNIYSEGNKLKQINCARHLGNLIIWNLKDGDDIQLKCGYLYGSVNKLCTQCNGILNNPDVASKLFMHIVFLRFPSSKTFLSNHLTIYVLRGKNLKDNF